MSLIKQTVHLTSKSALLLAVFLLPQARRGLVVT